MAPSGYTTPSNYTEPPKVLLTGLDSVYLSYWGDIRPELLNWIRTGNGEIKLNDLPFKLSPSGRGIYKAILANELMDISLDNKLPGYSSPSVYLQMKSEFLWSAGLVDAYIKVRRLIEWICEGDVYGEQISRVDIFVDLHWGNGFEAEDVKKFVTRLGIRADYRQDKTLSGFSLGKGDLRCRIYDKAHDARRTGKIWLFDLWCVGRDAPVWRVEIQLRRKKLSPFGVDSFEDVITQCQVMWDHCTEKAVRMCEIVGNNVTRRPLTPFWNGVQAARFELCDDVPLINLPPVARYAQSPQQVISQINGLIKSYAQQNKVTDPIGMYESWHPIIQRALKQWSGANTEKAI